MSRNTQRLTSENWQIKHFRYRKVTPEMLEFMKQLRSYKLNYRQIGQICELNSASVQYHLDPKTRRLTVARARRYNQRMDARKHPPERRANLRSRRWMKEYLRERYHSDPEFRTRIIRANMGGKFAD